MYINESKLISWHFTSRHAGYVLRKSEESLTAEKVYDALAADVHPLDVCCVCVYVDLNKRADVVHRVEYLVPY